MALKLTRRSLLATAAAAAAFPGYAADQPIRISVGFPPGGTTDVLARIVAANLGQKLGRSVIVENRPGASGNIAAQMVARSAPDGATLLFVPSSHATNASLYKKLPFDTEKDFTAIGMVARTPYVLVVHPRIPARSVAEFIALLKAQPGQFQYATASPGTGQHLAAELFKKLAGVEMTQIPYKGSSAALPDLIAGRTPIMFDNVALMVPHIRSGALRALGVTSEKRSPLLPSVAAVAETLPGYEIQGWFALLAPANTAPSLVREYNAALNAVVNDPAFVNRLGDLGAETMTGSPAMANEYIQKEVARWGGVIRSANISLD
ncbi:tripartite tricarboxylate transporter substrate binding protein [Ramlibacter ginsenosidimutans]|uniref:Tripartite tricarboxylate transporter substrate binding protein n=1 Tax=Ramlibacter ginsenosidimutans TaxID=502333 RepID=A0A934TU70_9BURK|nr:tripartite tricarboxylate transporter substrate binding protein [Ramlibacter ginsenosidimutans]MBK6007632.1 tripartite tricarboxylate transporter substrate binding protein [Ramlibacter ginsenosidimutans]